ncbi:alpha-amylase family protein [Histomonas meleagridis]|uniref:alpha-amylase family protein n=1 Tax=Histomonas meleagridis TaxID=135588 RepID=UPI00355A5073|nr:alpha-amylase family protein [Histomonas meleagridis]KAH0806975.1 alpha-amylase family protein [Histomonas meleagridis]
MLLLLMGIAYSYSKPTQLLEITTRPYLYKLGLKLGKTVTLRDIPQSEFDDWKAKGFQWVWFMGVWQVGPNGVQHSKTDAGCIAGYDVNCPGWTEEDVIGSPYAIVKYDVNVDIGTLDDLKWVREQLKARGIKLMLDFVPNHSATDAPEVTEKPNYYIRAPPGVTDSTRYLSNGVAYGCAEWCSPWMDTAQFNYFDYEFRGRQIQILKKIASLADGCRCDMSHVILKDAFEKYWKTELDAYGYTKPEREFWEEAIEAVKAVYPDFIFLAESYGDNEAKLVSLGFDYAYDKIPYDKLTYQDPSGFIQEIRNRNNEYMSHMCYFTENHDEKRAVANFFNNYDAANAAAAALLTLPGMRFFNQDQWLGPKNKIDVHLRRANAEPPNSVCVYFYSKLFEILKMDVMRNGEFQQLTCEGAAISAWKYSLGDEHILVTVNFGSGTAGGAIKLDDAPQCDKITVKELLTGDNYERNGYELRNSGLFVILDQYQVQIFKY